MHSVKLLLDNDGRESGQSAVQSETGGPGLRPIHCALIKYNRFNPHNSTACYQTQLQAWCITNSPGRPIPIALSVVPVADRNTGSLTRFWKYTWKYIWFMGVKLMFFYHLVQMCSKNSLWIWFWAIPLWLKVLCKAHMRYAFHKRKISFRFAEMIVIKDFDCAFKSKKKEGKIILSTNPVNQYMQLDNTVHIDKSKIKSQHKVWLSPDWIAECKMALITNDAL